MQQERIKIHKFWCHLCQLTFETLLTPGREEIVCPKCNQDYCQLRTKRTKPQQYVPYQKQPKNRPRNLLHVPRVMNQGSFFSNVAFNQINLSRIAENDEQQHIQITNQMLAHLRKRVQRQGTQCIICQQEIKVGETGLVSDCSHASHEQCLSQWAKIKNSCPICRNKIINIER